MLTQRCTALIGAIVGIVLTIVPAPAATYNYIGKPDASSGNYLTAVVELNCISCSAGTYDPYGPNPGISFVFAECLFKFRCLAGTRFECRSSRFWPRL